MQQLQVIHDILLFQRADYGTGLIIDFYAYRLKACGKSVIFIEKSVERAALRHLQRIEALSFAFLHRTEGSVQILHGLDGFQVNIIFLYILVIEIPELGNGGILVAGHSVYISADCNAVPQLFRAKAVKIRGCGLHHISQVLKCAQVDKLTVVGVVGKHHVEILAGIDNGIHLLIVIAPACHLDINFNTQLFHQVIIDICQTVRIVAGSGAAHRPPDQGGDIAACFICGSACICSALCRRCRLSPACFPRCRTGAGFCFGTAACQHTNTEYTGKTDSQ